MDDNPDPIDRRNNLSFVSDPLKESLGHEIQRKKRSLVQYIDCPGHPDTPPPTNGVGPIAKSSPAAVNSANPVGRISPASENGANPIVDRENGDEPVDRISPVLKNRGNPIAEMANGDDAVGRRILSAPENRVDSVDEMANGGDTVDGIPPALASEADPDVAMANGEDPVGRISPAPENRLDGVPPVLANEADPDAEIENGENPVAGIPVAPENRVEEAEAAGEEMPPEMREYITERMRGYQVQMIIEKALTATDMRTDQGRLLMPARQVRREFLTAEEERFLVYRSKTENELNYIDTLVVGSDLRENPMQFKKWKLGTKFLSCFINKWNCFSRTYGLRVGNRVRVWSFRVDQRDEEDDIVRSELRFALIKL